MSSSSSSSSGSSSSRRLWKYKQDVFLSFQGNGPTGTRLNFTDVLYHALTGKGLSVYIDDKKLEQGMPILEGLFTAIRQSRFCVVVFSRDYASSKWCLDELALIVECVELSRKSDDPRDWVDLLPVFHEVEPSDVRHVRGSFAESFSKHEEALKNDPDRVRRWKAAMEATAHFSGWPTRGRRWTELTEEIARYVMNRLSGSFLSISHEFVGLNSRVREVIALLGIGRDDNDHAVFVGIWGMSGIGKTTLAEAIYEEIRHSFEAAAYLRDIQATPPRKGLLWLQEKLLAELLREEKISLGNVSRGRHEIARRLQSRKVLVVLDNIDSTDQLYALVGHPGWFHPESRVIITTRDGHLLKAHDISIIYKVELLIGVQAQQLFCRKAFNSDFPKEGYEELTKSFVNIAGGLPLALKHFGSWMKGRSIAEWESALSSLAKISPEDIHGKLSVSFDGLSDAQKRVFLLVAFFFRGKDEGRVKDVLYRCNLDPIINIQGTPAVNGIVADIPVDRDEPLNPKAFSTMERLELLQIKNARFYDRLRYLSNQLRFLKWRGFPFEILPTTFEANNLVELNMSRSHLTELWRGRKEFRSLKIIKLSHSQHLMRTPDFSGAPNLERLILEGCVGLRDVDRSIGLLQKLDFLDLRGCRSLMALPDSICSLGSLRILHLSGCSRLVSLPTQLHHLGSLEELNLAGTAIKELPTSIGSLKKLKVLSFHGCAGSGGGNLSLWLCFPWFFMCPGTSSSSRGLLLPPMSGLTSLTTLLLSDCYLVDGEIPDDLDLLGSLEIVSLEGNLLTRVPAAVTRMTKLKYLSVSRCENLHSVPTLPSVEWMFADDCPSLELIPNQFAGATELSFLNCPLLAGNYASNDLMTALLKQHLSTPPIHEDAMFCVWLPGTEIPEWFGARSTGNTVKAALPERAARDRWKGFAWCCIFELVKQEASGTHIYNDGVSDFTHIININMRTDKGATRNGGWPVHSERNIRTEHSLLAYASPDLYWSSEHLDEADEMTFLFEAMGEGLVIRSCGVHLVLENE
ncbi:hypothetical protein MLD38_018163 [Melastoma candidum]|uniref:Uncharacterized protein n=1 Tax=Melastoma candidum TaxID=119954 RepID=A0ACB9QS40_9MYRT|nr:hypothetical protein MLD38_018163 [Melastoma candidum]